MTRPTLAQRRRTASTPEIEALDRIWQWLDDHKRLHRLDPRGAVHVHLHRQSVHHPWAEVGTHPSVLEFGLTNAIISRRDLA